MKNVITPVGILVTLTLSLLLLLNAPLWLSTRLHIFGRGPESPRWLVRTVTYTNRLLGIAGLISWLIIVNQGNAQNTWLLGSALLGGLLLLLNIPYLFVSRIKTIPKSQDVPFWLLQGYLWSSHVIGGLVVLTVPLLVLWLY